jgi:hypothetical protein
MRKIIVISGIVILIVTAAFLAVKYYPFRAPKPVIQTFSTKQNPAFKAVPLKSPLVIEVKDQEGFFNALKGEKQVLSELKGIPEVEKLFSDISNFKDFVSTRSGIKNILSGKSIIISINPTGKNQLSNLYLVQMNNAIEAGSVTDVVSNELGGEYTISRRNYDNTIIFNAKSDKLNFFFACASDIFMASDDFIRIEDAIRHAHSQNLLENREFTEVYKTIEETALANIFINHTTIHQILAKLVAPEIRKSINQLASYSNWTGLDLTLNSSEINLNGYSVTRDSSDNYLNIFNNQEAEKLTIEKVIPANSSYFLALNLKNTSEYIDHYEAYLRAKGDYYPREMSTIEFKKKTGADPTKLFKELAGKQFAGVFTSINKSNPTQNRFFVAELINTSDAKEKLKKAATEFARTSKASGDKPITPFTSGNKKSIDIYKLPFGNMAESVFGKAFSGINAEYFTLYEKYLICGDNLQGLKNYLQSVASEKTMAKDSVYQAYIRNTQPNPNFYLYSRIPKIFRLKDVLLKPAASLMLSENEDVIRKYSTFSWQFSVSDKMIKNRIRIKYDPLAKEEPQAVWQLKLDGQLAQTPKFVLNHKDLPNREIIVTDKNNNVSLINKEGLVLWTLNIPGEIISDIHQIDIYRTNRFQYIFNTKTQLYVIDRIGNKVGKFPVALKSIASNGVSVAEYGKNKEYRFFVAGEDKIVYAFDRDGRLVPKWNPEPTAGIVTKPVAHYEIEDKDYLVFSDNQDIYFLDRQGKRREFQPASFNHSANQTYYFNEGNPKLITTDQTGKIHSVDFAGQAEIKEVGKFGAGHHFVVQDLDGNGSSEYIFAEGKKLSVFAADGKKIFEHSFPESISETPVICAFGQGNIKIGIVIGNENKIYLIEKNGSITRGFPLDGNTCFTFGKFNDTNSWMNLLVGGEGNSLINYRIE